MNQARAARKTLRGPYAFRANSRRVASAWSALVSDLGLVGRSNSRLGTVVERPVHQSVAYATLGQVGRAMSNSWRIGRIRYEPREINHAIG